MSCLQNLVWHAPYKNFGGIFSVIVTLDLKEYRQFGWMMHQRSSFHIQRLHIDVVPNLSILQELNMKCISHPGPWLTYDNHSLVASYHRVCGPYTGWPLSTLIWPILGPIMYLNIDLCNAWNTHDNRQLKLLQLILFSYYRHMRSTWSGPLVSKTRHYTANMAPHSQRPLQILDHTLPGENGNMLT